MKRMFLLGRDIHSEQASNLTGKLIEELTKEERKLAKAVNFGFLYGMFPKKFIKYCKENFGIDVSLAEAEVARDKYFAQFPGLVRWHSRQKRLAHRHQQVSSAIGRVRHLPDIMSPDNGVRMEAERQAINSPIQGLASDITLFGMVKLHPLLDHREARMVMTLHDGIGFEIKEDRVEHYAPLIKETLENLPLAKTFGARISVPLIADVEAGTHWKGIEDASGLGFVDNGDVI
jgi:DNA polymerase I-like protein with 3'-5' exonuclease and polymerase domains